MTTKSAAELKINPYDNEIPARFVTSRHAVQNARTAECSPCHRDECADLRCLERLTVDGAWELLRAMLERSIAQRAT